MTSGVDKFECTLCHKNARFPGGIIVSPSLKWGMCEEHAPLLPPTDDSIFVRYCQTRIEKVKSDGDKEPTPKRLAIGLPGGFNLDETEVSYIDGYVAVERRDVGFVDVTIANEAYSNIVENIRSKADNLQIAMQSAVANMWGGDDRPVSKHSHDLEQLPYTGSLPAPTANGEFKCQQEGCDVIGNVWLNLSDGTILCGRRQMLSMDSIQNGNMHALQHFENTGKKYPLVVKLGTIDASGQADVYSYDEDSEVTDSHLKRHLAHFGIDMCKMEKTCRTLEELQVELNLKHDWSAITGADEDHKPVYGPNRTGMVNLGNTCYMNSVMQALAQVDFWKELYSTDQLSQWATAYSFERIRPFDQINFLIGRLFISLASGVFSKAPDNQHPDYLNAINPLAFRKLIGANHPEFATSRQQDADDFLRYFLDICERTPPPFGEATIADAFRFKQEIRSHDVESGKVGYQEDMNVVLPLMIDLSSAVNINDVIQYEMRLRQIQAEGKSGQDLTPVFARIGIETLLTNAFSDNLVADAVSAVSGERTGVMRRHLLKTMPNYLWVMLQRFGVSDDGFTAKKFPVDVIDAQHINLEMYRAKGPQPGEVLIDEEALRKTIGPQINPEFVDMIVAMGFPESQAREAVKQTNNQGAEQALNWLFANPDAIPSELMSNDNASASSKSFTDGIGNYSAKAIVVHLGRNTHSGHYIAYVKDQQLKQWICYNDEKIYALPVEKVPIEKAYLILYERAS